MVSEDSTCTAAREPSSAAASYSREQKAAACGVLHNVQTDTQWSGNKITILCQSEHQKIPPHPKHSRLKKHFFSSRNPMYLLAATINTNGDISGMPSMQPTEHPRTPPPGSTVRTRASLSLMRTFTEVFFLASKCDWRSRSLTKLVEVAIVGPKIRLASWLGCVIYFTV